MQPLITIIIPSFNSGAVIKNCLESIVAQTYVTFEVLVIDNVSTDITAGVVNGLVGKDSRFKFISGADQGIYDAMNKGIRLSKGDYLYFMGADDVFYGPRVLEEVFSTLQNSPDMIYGSVLFRHAQKEYDGYFDLEKLYRRNICHQAIFYHRSVFEKVGLYNLKYKVCSDHDFNLRCFNSGLDIRYIDKLIVDFNDQGTSSRIEDTAFQRERVLQLLQRFEDPAQVYSGYQRYHQLLRSPDYRIGRFVLGPLRFLKYSFARVRNLLP